MAKLWGKVMVVESTRQSILMLVIILNVIMAFLQLTVISSGIKIESRWKILVGNNCFKKLQSHFKSILNRVSYTYICINT